MATNWTENTITALSTKNPTLEPTTAIAEAHEQHLTTSCHQPFTFFRPNRQQFIHSNILQRKYCASLCSQCPDTACTI